MKFTYCIGALAQLLTSLPSLAGVPSVRFAIGLQFIGRRTAAPYPLTFYPATPGWWNCTAFRSVTGPLWAWLIEDL